MRVRALVLAIIATVVVVGAVIVAGGEDERYEAVLHLDDALGLRDGSKVVVGGVEVGRVDLDLDKGDRVVARLKLDDEHAPIGRGASATVTSVNLLGEKSLELDMGDKSSPVPSGVSIPASRVTPSTDLDQILNVLDTDTRARLTILLNEAGAAFAGRRVDVSRSLKELPTALAAGRQMLERLVADGRTLGALVRRSDRFVTRVAAEREHLGDLLDAVGRGAETAATKRAELRVTLQRLPGTLATARSFLDDLRRTTVPLGPAARNLSATAKPLEQTLAQLEPFTKAATPALREARGVAPRLTRLAAGATPVIKRAGPVVSQLATLSSDLKPVTNTLDKSAENIIATVANWTHAIQFRDGLGHVFRAQVAVTPQTLNYFLDRLEPKATEKKSRRRPAKPAAPDRPKLPELPRLPKLLDRPLENTKDQVRDLLEPVTGVVDRLVPRSSDTKSTDALLDLLLGP